MFDANFKGRIILEGSGRQYRAFVHVDKICSILAQLFTKEVPAGTYNAVEHNLSIREIARQVAAIYPGLEQLAVSQNMPMRRIWVKTPCRILDYVELPSTSFEEELREFKEHFSF